MFVPRRALIVVDVQQEYFTGNLPIEYPNGQRSLTSINRAMDAAQRFDVPVVVVQNSAVADSAIFAKGSPGWQLHPSVAHRPRAHFLEKALPSALADTDLGAWLTRERINTLTLVGYMIHNCIAATAMQALHSGLTVEVLGDATGAVSYANAAGHASAEEIWRSFCVVLQSRFAAVLTTDEWIDTLHDGSVPERGSILHSYRSAHASGLLV